MKTITWKQGSITYILNGGLGSWAKSFEYEDLKPGTVRYIKGELMYLYSKYKRGLFKPTEYNWTPVDEDVDFEHLRKWVNK